MLATELLSQTALRFVLLGMATGSLTALVGLGVVLVYRASGVLNFASAALGAVGAFVCYSLRDDHGWPWWLALGAGLLVGGALGAGTYVVMAVIRQASLLTKLIATLGLLSGAQGFMVVVWGTDVRQPDSMLPTDVRTLGGDLRIGQDRLVLIGFVALLAMALRLVYSRTSFGLATSAVAESRRLAASAGWSPNAIELTNFVAAGFLATLAAILLAPIVTLNAGVLSLAILAAMAAALVGGFSSFAITVGAALLIGVIQSEVSLFLPEISTALGVREQALAGLPALGPLLVILLHTVATGRGLPSRGETSARLPLPGAGTVSLVPLVAGVGAATVLLFRASTWQDALITTIGISIILCSVIVVSGFAGQLSLCQYALGGFGAWIAARMAETGVPFELALFLGVVAAIALGILVALPALRTRGVNLAIATLALALMINALVFTNSSATGGIGGVRVPSPSLLGVDIDAIDHPERYGLVLLVALVAVGLLVANVRRGRTGRRLLAVRSNERAAAAMGIGVTGVKLYAFGLAAGIAAIGGTLLAFRRPQIQFQEFDVFGSILLVQFAVLGGLGWVSGVVAGAVAAPGGVAARLASGIWPDATQITSWLAIISAIGVVHLIRVAPDGIAAMWSRTPIARALRPWSFPRPKVEDVELEVLPGHAPAPLVIDDVAVRFGGVAAVAGVSFEVRPGEIIGLIGPNGAGKTTLLDIITGFTKADRGTVRLGAVDITRLTPERRARLGMARSWQAVELFEEMTIRENLLVGCDGQDRRRFFTDLLRPGRQRLTALASEIVTELGLWDVLDDRPSSLPQGHARLVGIARAIVGEPAVVLLDEPAAGLAADECAELVSVIRSIAARGIGVLIIEHDVPLLVDICDRIVALDFGKVLAQGTPAQITSDDRVIRSYLGDPQEIDGLQVST